MWLRRMFLGRQRLKIKSFLYLVKIGSSPSLHSGRNKRDKHFSMLVRHRWRTLMPPWVSQDFDLFLLLAMGDKCGQPSLTAKPTPGGVFKHHPYLSQGLQSIWHNLWLNLFNLLVLIQGLNLRTTSGLQEIMWQVAPSGSALWLNRKTDTGNKHHSCCIQH